MSFITLLRSFIRIGGLDVIDPAGNLHRVGSSNHPEVSLRLLSTNVELGLLMNPRLWLGQAYVDGRITFVRGGIFELLSLLAKNLGSSNSGQSTKYYNSLCSRLTFVNGIAGSQRNVKRHYDLPQNLYRLFLDPDLQYSCAYYRSINDSLEKAQLNKKHHIATKLLLDRPALRVLDIGSGWGGLGIFLAQIARAAVTGITLSKEQLLTSRSRAAEAGLSGAVCFYHRDYRQEHGEYDRVVSVGMLEHVGKRHYARYFQKIHELLTNEGVALVHTIGYADSPAPIDPFIRKFIFPGAELPSLSELLPAIEKSGLYVTDIEILRLHYARTLQQWRDRLSAHRNKIIDIHGVSFYRMWEYYLALCEVGFRLRSNVVFQIQLAKDPGVVPPTRDYMYETISDKMDLELTPSNRTRDGLGQNVLAG